MQGRNDMAHDIQNGLIMIGSIVGMALGGWLAAHFFYESGDVGLGVTAFSGAIPGAIVGGWITLKVLQRLAR